MGHMCARGWSSYKDWAGDWVIPIPYYKKHYDMYLFNTN